MCGGRGITIGPLLLVRCSLLQMLSATDNGRRTTHKSAETPERRHAPPRCSDVSFIVKHLPRAVDPETALHGKRMLQPREGGQAKSRNFAQPTMKPQRISII